jgi:hypothetical protein
MPSPTRRTLGPVAQGILAYLSRHPNARDTTEGIAEWWLSQPTPSPTTTETQVALDQLVSEGWMRAWRGPDGQVRYSRSPGRQRPRRRARHRESGQSQPSTLPNQARNKTNRKR